MKFLQIILEPFQIMFDAFLWCVGVKFIVIFLDLALVHCLSLSREGAFVTGLRNSVTKKLILVFDAIIF